MFEFLVRLGQHIGGSLEESSKKTTLERAQEQEEAPMILAA